MRAAAFIDPRMPDEAVSGLKKKGFLPMKVPLCSLVDRPVSGHPDIQIFVYRNRIFFHPHMDRNFIETAGRYFETVPCTSALTDAYPGDIAYNIACTGKFAVHRTDRTDSTIHEFLKTRGIEMIHTNQGYSKCSTLIVDRESIITADRSIHRAAEQKGASSMLISPGYIELPGYSYGFIGGASGMFENTVYFTGNIDSHPDKKRIISFIEERNMKAEILSSGRALDTGSILFAEPQ